MISLLRKDSLQLFWLLFHIALGFACVWSKWPLIAWFYTLMGTSIFMLFYKPNQQSQIIFLLGYSLGIEVLARGIFAAPFIPDQVGKYLGVVLFLFGLLLGGPIKKQSVYGIFMLLLSIPALVVAADHSRKAIVFNYFGPLTLFLGVMFCSKQILTFKDVKQLMRVVIYAILALACFTIYRASQFDRIEYSVSANYETGGGSITNQVSTLFGIAISLLFVMFLTKQNLFRFKVVDIALLSLFILRGLLTFSRGGMVSAFLAIMVVIIFPKAKAAWQDAEVRLRSFKMINVFGAALIIIIGFLVINSYTNNYLLYRYQGKTQRTIQTGFEEKRDLNEATSGRWKIFISDLQMFIDKPLLGVGVGEAPKERVHYGFESGVLAHLEFSRLLAEHGIPGLVIAIMIYIIPFMQAYREPNNYRKSLMLLFLIMGLSTTFHSAMRTLSAPLLVAFAFIHFVPTDYDWRGHLARAKKVAPRGKKLYAEKEMELA